jgi:hypothetical protein
MGTGAGSLVAAQENEEEQRDTTNARGRFDMYERARTQCKLQSLNYDAPDLIREEGPRIISETEKRNILRCDTPCIAARFL